VAPGKAEDPRLMHKQAKHSGSGGCMTHSGSGGKLGSTGKQLGSLSGAHKLGSMGALATAFSVQPSVGSYVGGGVAGGGGGGRVKDSEAYWQKTLSLRNTSIALEDILQVGSFICGFVSAAVLANFSSVIGWVKASLLLRNILIALKDILQVGVFVSCRACGVFYLGVE
jgi:hypothetical protein